MSLPQSIIDIAEICARQGVRQLIMSPGSRNAPLVLAFNRHPEINTTVIPDERAAGYIGLGMAQALSQPVLLVCTSGTAVLNYGPAIAEAYYQQVPLIVITADRPPEWIDQKDGQAVRQRNVFESHVKKSFELPVAQDHPDAAWHAHRIINEAIITSRQEIQGPVHINAPFREPFYPEPSDDWIYGSQVPVVRRDIANPTLLPDQWSNLISRWQQASKILVVGGQQPMSGLLTQALSKLREHTGITLVGDAVSNLHQVPQVIHHPELILGQADDKIAELAPDLLISFGGGLISKNLKLFLRKFKPAQHWHLQPWGYPSDTFQSLTDIIPLVPADFFTELLSRLPAGKASQWGANWQKQDQLAASAFRSFMHHQEFNELQTVGAILNASQGFHLHLANSTPVRWVDLYGLTPEIKQISANRGTSGIDGCTSSAVGHALADQGPHLLITGDMGFFYDRNAFWHQYQLPNLKVVLLNNHGGGIFKLIEGPSKQPELDDLFVTKQKLKAKNTSEDFGLKYLYCNQPQDLEAKLNELLKPHDHACLLEVEFPDNMGDIYQELKAFINNGYE